MRSWSRSCTPRHPGRDKHTHLYDPRQEEKGVSLSDHCGRSNRRSFGLCPLNLNISVGHFLTFLSPLILIPLNPNISVGHDFWIMPIKGSRMWAVGGQKGGPLDTTSEREPPQHHKQEGASSENLLNTAREGGLPQPHKGESPQHRRGERTSATPKGRENLLNTTREREPPEHHRGERASAKKPPHQRKEERTCSTPQGRERPRTTTRERKPPHRTPSARQGRESPLNTTRKRINPQDHKGGRTP